MSMDSEKFMDTVNSGLKLAANLTTQKTPKIEEKKEDNLNQPHNQTVEVKVGDQGENRKPVIIREKPEIHEHKVFPEARELSEKECDSWIIIKKMEHEKEMKRLDSEIERERYEREERREHEEYARKERERRRERDRKAARRLGICAGIVGVGCIGYTAYCLYSDSRRAKGNRVALGEQPAVQVNAVPAEGSVE